MNVSFHRIHPSILLFATIFLASLIYMHPVDLSGDEVSYERSSRELFNALVNFNFYSVDLVKNAWFPPGMAIALLPIQAIFLGDAPRWALRIYILTINVSLIFVICQYLRFWLSEKRISVFLMLLLLNPYYVTHLSTLWTELIALHGALLLLFWVHHEYANGREKSLFLLGFLCSIIAIIRALYLPLPLFVALTMQLANSEQSSLIGDARKVLQNTLAMIIVLAGIITPWTMEVSSKFGPTFLHRGSEMSRIHTYADTATKKEMQAETGHKNAFFAIQDTIAENASTSERTFAQQSKIELARALRQVDDEEFAARFRRNVDRFFALKTNGQFMSRYSKHWCVPANTVSCFGATVALKIHHMIWPVMLCFGLILFLLPVARPADGFLYLPFVYKGFFALVAIHPLLVFAHGRYIAQFIPLIALAIACFDLRDLRQVANIQTITTDKILTIGQIFAIVCLLMYAAMYVSGVNLIIR